MKRRTKILGAVLAVLLLITALPVFSGAAGSGATSLIEGFDNISALTGNGWKMQNNSSPIGITDWFQGTSMPEGGPFDSYNGVTNAYLAANFNNTAVSGTISNWLVTPELYLTNGSTFTFFTRKPTGTDYPDRLEVRMSTTGFEMGTGATDTGDFTTLLLSVNPTLTTGVYPTAWMQYTATVTGLDEPADGYIAFRYFVTNGGPTGANSDYIGIDAVSYTAAPTADVAVTAVVSDDKPAVGDTVEFTVTASNSGAGAASHVTVSAPLPPGLTYVAWPCTQGTYDNATGVWDLGYLAAGDSATLTLVATVDTFGLQTLNASISAAESDTDLTNNQASVSLAGYGEIAYTGDGYSEEYDGSAHGITLDVDTAGVTVKYRTAASGVYDLTEAPTYTDVGTHTVYFELTRDYYNTVEGSETVTIEPGELTVDVIVNDKLYDGLNTASFNGTPFLVGVLTGEDVSLISGVPTFSSTAVGEDIAISFTAFSLTGEDAGNYTVTQPTGIVADIQPNVNMAIAANVNEDEPTIGDSVNFTVSVSNNGLSAASHVEVLALLPVGFTYESSDPSQGTYDDTTGVWSVGSLAAGGSATLTVTATVDAVGPKTVDATVAAAESDTDLTNNEASISLTGYGEIEYNAQAYSGTYNGQVHGITLNVNTEDVTVRYRTTDNGVYNLSEAPEYTDVGIYTVYFQLTKEYYISAEGSETVTIDPKGLTVDVAVSDKPYDGLDTAAFVGTPSLVGVLTGEDVGLESGVPTFSAVAIGNNIPVNLTAFSLTGADMGNYSLTQPASITANILPGFTPVLDTHYTASGLNSDGVLDVAFVLTAKTGYLLSLTDTAAGTWNESLSYADIVSGNSLSFYVKNTTTGEISVAKSYTAEYKVLTAFTAFTGSGNITARIDAELGSFLRLILGGSAVDPANYTTESGSTVITLKESYLDGLKNGTYTFLAEFSDGRAELTVVINAMDPGPDTGDSSVPLVWPLLGAASLLCSAALITIKRRLA